MTGKRKRVRAGMNGAVRAPVQLRRKRGTQHRWVATVTFQLGTAGMAGRWATSDYTALRQLQAYPNGPQSFGVLGTHVYCIDCEQLHADVHEAACEAPPREQVRPSGLIVP